MVTARIPIGRAVNENNLFVKPIYIVIIEMTVIMANEEVIALDNFAARQKWSLLRMVKMTTNATSVRNRYNPVCETPVC